MPSPIRGSTLRHRELLSTGWDFCSVPADAFRSPSELHEGLNWLHARVPSTAASALRDLAQWTFDTPARRFDAEDWWYRCEFAAQRTTGTIVLGFDGLATLADVWLNGEHILCSENMFLAHEVDVSTRIKEKNHLCVRFRSLDKALAVKRARPRWKAPMLDNQQLRWFRTTVLGRTPGWSPSAAAVGPWRPVWIEYRDEIDITHVGLQTSLHGTSGHVQVKLQHSSLENTKIVSADLVLARDAKCFSNALVVDSLGAGGHLVIPEVERWWPHTHGTPALYSAQVHLQLQHGDAGSSAHIIELGNVGFRTVRVDTSDSRFRVLVNEVPIFCRGACWTPIDSISLHASKSEYERAIQGLCDIGMNMIRIAGTMIYEDRGLLDACDRLGVLVWQEFMFANMDYPAEDANFLANVQSEIAQTLEIFQQHACIAILCGNSEVEQQAAMFGTTRDRWTPALFHEVIPELIKRDAPGIFYWPSSAHGGSFPHQPNVGTTSYYGVGAYLRAIEDARRSDVRFATECLAFANPKTGTLESSGALQPLANQSQPSVIAEINSDRHTQHAFEYVRDFYLAQLFAADPRQLFDSSRDRYAHLAEAAAGEVMVQCFNEWRRPQSTCGGALIWFWRDLIPGNGWGVLSRCGTPKPVYYYLRRALAPLRIFMTDEGCNQPALHVANDTATAFIGKIVLKAFRKDGAAPLEREMELRVEGHQSITLPTTALLEWFVDIGYVFQFGPPTYDVLAARLIDASGSIASDTTLLPLGLGQTRPDPLLSVQIDPSSTTPQLVLRSEKFAQCVRIASANYVPEDNYFAMLPGSERTVRMSGQTRAGDDIISIRDVNSNAPLTVSLELSRQGTQLASSQ